MAASVSGDDWKGELNEHGTWVIGRGRQRAKSAAERLQFLR
jgi:hypothetical protein